MKIKHAIFLSLCLFSFQGFAQIQWHEESQTARMEGVVQIENVDQAELFKRAKIWVAGNLKSSDNNTLIDDESNGTIISTGNLFLNSNGFQSNRFVNFKISLYFKDGKYRYVIDQLVGTETSTMSNPPVTRTEALDNHYKGRHGGKKRSKLQDELDVAFGAFVGKLEKSMRGDSDTKSNDW